MTLSVLALVLAAALLHATWNAVLRGGADRLWSMTVMSATMAGLSAVCLPLSGGPGLAGWGYAALSGVLHIGYNLALVRMYRRGELGQTYPVARGSSPVLVALGAAAFAGEALSPLNLLGLALVCGGILALALRGRRFDVQSIPAALATGCFIGAYSVVDGLGVRASDNALGYIAASNLLGGGFTVAVLLSLPSLRGRRSRPADTARAAAGGVAALAAYGTVIWAFGHAAMGPVSALRETGVVFAALIGRFFLHETLTPQRLVACGVIALGAACLGQAATHP